VFDPAVRPLRMPVRLVVQGTARLFALRTSAGRSELSRRPFRWGKTVAGWFKSSFSRNLPWALWLLVLSGSASQAAAQEPLHLTFVQLSDVGSFFPVAVQEPGPDGNLQVANMGGMAHIKTLVDRIRDVSPECRVIDAGDIISPSLLSAALNLKGRHMIQALNTLGVDLAIFGNHEFDFGCRVLEERVAESKFLWIASNIRFPAESEAFRTKVQQYYVEEVDGVRIGFLGLTVPLDRELACPGYTQGVSFENPLAAARRAMAEMEAKEVDVLVAVTHLDLATDTELAERYPQLSLIMGAHDHELVHSTVGSTVITKVDADGQHIGRLDVEISAQPQIGVEIEWEAIPVLSDEIPPDPTMAALIGQYEPLLEPFLEPIGVTLVPLDASRQHLRSRETNAGNFVADVLRREGKAEVALINGGGIRSSRAISAGATLTLADVWDLYPLEDRVVTAEVSGSTLLAALENGVARWEEKDGAFPQVSGMRFTFDPSHPPGRRIVEVRVGSHPLEEDREYRLATADYLACSGGDGYDMLATKSLETYRRLADVIAEAIRAAGTISPRVEGRIVNLVGLAQEEK